MSRVEITIEEDLLFRLFLRTYVVEMLTQERWRYLDGAEVTITSPPKDKANRFNFTFFGRLSRYCMVVGRPNGTDGTRVIREDQVGVRLLVRVDSKGYALTFSLAEPRATVPT